MVSLFALPTEVIPYVADQLQKSVKPPVIWLSFQECTGCTESFTRSHTPTIEDLIFNHLSLDYHHTLQAASGEAAERARMEIIEKKFGNYLLIVDGSIPLGDGGVYSTIAGKTNLAMLQESTNGARAIISVGSCAAYGGLPAANPNPTGAVSVGGLMDSGLIDEKPLVNIPGCPPIPIAISGVLAHFIVFGAFPELDDQYRPRSIYGDTVHDHCYRYHFYQEKKFAESFDDEGARKGWCLYKLGCRGPITHNACSIYKWNNGTSFPIQSGHTCIGCTEPGFWDMGGFYRSLEDLVSAYIPSNEPLQDSIEAGQQLYEDNCVYCHAADPADLETPAEAIPELLRSGSIRSHRRLEFSEDQLNILKKYIGSKK